MCTDRNVSANNSETAGHKVVIFGKIIYILVFYNISWIARSGTQSTKRETPSPTVVLWPTKDHGVLLTKRVKISSVRLCSPANTKLRRLKVPPQSRPTVDRVKRISSRLVIKFTFFVVLDTCQSIKRKLSWGRYWGWGNSLLVYFASDWPGAYYPTPITPNNLTAGKKAN